MLSIFGELEALGIVDSILIISSEKQLQQTICLDYTSMIYI